MNTSDAVKAKTAQQVSIFDLAGYTLEPADSVRADDDEFGPVSMPQEMVEQKAENTQPPPPRDDGKHAKAKKPEAQPYPVMTGADLLEAEIPTTPWVVERFIPEGSVVVCLAHPKGSKTWISIDIGIAVATGCLALHGFKVHKPGKVLMWLSEDNTRGARSRIEALCAGRGINAEEAMRNIYIHTRDTHRLIPGAKCVRLDVTDTRSRNEFIAFARTINPDLVVLDTMMSVSEVKDESSSGEMNRVMKHLRDIRDALGCSILVTHHLGKDNDTNLGRDIFQRARGSSAIRGAWDGAFAIQPKNGKADGKDTFRIDFEMRDASSGEHITVTKDILTDGNGLAIKARFFVTQQDEAKQEEAQQDEQRKARKERVVSTMKKMNKEKPGAWWTKVEIENHADMKATHVRAMIDGLLRDEAIEQRKEPGERYPRFRWVPPTQRTEQG